MGGICVQVTFDGGAVERSAIDAMAAAAAHRGADGTNVWVGPGAGLAHQRTVLVPEDLGDAQPCRAAGLVAVADARVDNRDELLPVLVHGGYLADPSDVPDSELILAAYRLWGDGCAARLIGDFAFAVWDERRRRLFAARDPMGMRALYYRSEPGRRLLAATEIKQLLTAAGVPRRIHEPALAATLAGPHTPPAWTLYEGIDQLPPGHALRVDAGATVVQQFFRPRVEARFHPARQPEAQEAFHAAFAQAVQARLRGVRPTGIFLSGGMDSGSVASMAGWLAQSASSPPAVFTYSWAFDELPDADERGVSDLIVARYDALTATAVPADDSWPLAGYPDHGPDEDDPYSWVYQALVERTLQRCRNDGVGVMINGDRGDELTGDWAFDELGLARHGHLAAAWADLSQARHLQGVSTLVALRRQVIKPLVAARWPGLSQRIGGRRHGGAPWPPWVADPFAQRVSLADVIADGLRIPSFDGAARSIRYQRIFLPQAARIAVLRERTRARRGMGFADPYADRRLIELVLSMPQWLVQRRTQPKALARAAMAGVMPEEARSRVSKTIPYSLFDRGFRERAVPVATDLLTNSMLADNGWLDEGAARRIYFNFVETGDSRWDFWWPLTVEMWLRRWWA